MAKKTISDTGGSPTDIDIENKLIEEQPTLYAPGCGPQDHEPELVTVPADQLQALIALNAEYKADILTMVSTFNGLQSLFSGGNGLMSIIPVVTKLINNPAKMQELSAIVPVMEKYIQKDQPNEH